ncbi:FAD-dependent monooxygenase [Nocardia sp. NPDC051750]|uniref:FAD-dependent monooxygenase n=1 Tax=Nocardia sp. NPDC051750 TaxID=3364325 RepID=UPI0037A8051E
MTQVVVAGGGTVGLATAVLLAHHGVPAQVFESREAPSVHPRALGLSPRTLEIFREVGLGKALDQAAVQSALPWKADARTVAEIDRDHIPPRPAMFDATVAEQPRGHYPQDRIDAVLLPAARERGATVEFGVAVTDITQDDAAVDVTLSDGRVVRADYLIGADGLRSTVRERLGIATTGPGRIGEPTMNILFEADLVGYFGSMPTMTEIGHPDVQGMLLAVGEHRWVIHVPTAHIGDIGATIRTALGAEVPVEIIGAVEWRATVLMAEEFRCGRVFLAGDAARSVSPLGAFGLNTGLADAHNLAWKIAMVLSGQAGPALLDSYHDERHAVAEFVTRQALLRWENPRLHWDPRAVAERAAVSAWNAPMVTMGYRYDSGAIIGPVPPVPSTEDVVASLDGAPGSRLPHRWLDEPELSTLDVNESGFAVLTGPAGRHWRTAAGDLGVRAVELPADWPASVGISAEGALLVRPDGFIAWRTTGPAGDLAEVYATVTGR